MATKRKCEVCGASDADNRGLMFNPAVGGIEIRSWTGPRGKWRVRCGTHKLKSQR